jgi:hypothetical protein
VKNLFLKYFIPALLLLNLQLLAQKKELSPVNALDDMYTPRGSIFQQVKASPGKSREREEISYAIKFMPVDLFRGNLVFENEWNIPGTAVNLVGGVGYHVSQGGFERDGMDLTLDTEAGEGLAVEDAFSYGTYKKGGLFYSMGAKFYGNVGWYYNTGASAFYGIYTSLKYEHYKYSYTLNPVIKGIPVTGSRDYNITSNVIHWGVGCSGVTNGKIKTYHDVYVGVAVNVRSYSRFDTQSAYPYYQYGYGQGSEYIVNGRSQQVNFMLDFGYCIGLAFK